MDPDVLKYVVGFLTGIFAPILTEAFRKKMKCRSIKVAIIGAEAQDNPKGWNIYITFINDGDLDDTLISAHATQEEDKENDLRFALKTGLNGTRNFKAPSYLPNKTAVTEDFFFLLHWNKPPNYLTFRFLSGNDLTIDLTEGGGDKMSMSFFNNNRVGSSFDHVSVHFSGKRIEPTWYISS